MPPRTTCSAPRAVRLRPSSCTRPPRGGNQPAIVPEQGRFAGAVRPTTARISPLRTWRSIPSSARTAPRYVTSPRDAQQFRAGIVSAALGQRRLGLAEIRFDHGGIALHLGRCAVGELGAAMHHDDAIRDRHHRAHVVFDHHPASRRRPAPLAARRRTLRPRRAIGRWSARRAAARRAARRGAREFEQPLLSERQRFRLHAGKVGPGRQTLEARRRAPRALPEASRASSGTSTFSSAVIAPNTCSV